MKLAILDYIFTLYIILIELNAVAEEDGLSARGKYSKIHIQHY